MSSDAFRRYREAVLRRAEAKKALIDCHAEVIIAKMEIELAADPPSPAKSTTEQFIDDHRDKLEPDDIEFMAVNYRGASEVSRHTAISQTSLKRLANAGTLEVRRTPSGHRRYSTVSVVRYLISDREESQ